MVVDTLLCILAVLGSSPGMATDEPLRQVQTIPLPGVEGRIDHLAVDLKGSRLFIAALGNNTVEVVDLKKGQRSVSLKGFHEPQGIAYLPEFDRIVVANGQGGGVAILDGKTYNVTHRIEPLDDADNVRYDPVAKRVWVGYGSGALAEIDAATGKKLADIKLPGHPESFQLEKNGHRIFVNVPTARQIVVVDRSTHRLSSNWPVTAASANFPMALNEAWNLLIIGCRQPPKVLLYDTRTSNYILSIDAVGDTDDLFWDHPGGNYVSVYVSGGQGRIDLIRVAGDDRTLGRWMSEKAGATITAPGARTSLFVPQLHRIYLAVPHRGSQRAEIRVYQL